MSEPILMLRAEIHALENHIVRLEHMVAKDLQIYLLNKEVVDRKLIEGKDYKLSGHRNILLFNTELPHTSSVVVNYKWNCENAVCVNVLKDRFNSVNNDKIYIIPTADDKPVKIIFEEKEKNDMRDIYLSSAWKREYEWLLEPFMAPRLPAITIPSDFITDVKIIVENKVVEVTFKDGEKIKTVCDESDTFSLENAISIAITKKLLGGTGAYNKTIKNGMKVYENRIESEKKKAEEDNKIA